MLNGNCLRNKCPFPRQATSPAFKGEHSLETNPFHYTAPSAKHSSLNQSLEIELQKEEQNKQGKLLSARHLQLRPWEGAAESLFHCFIGISLLCLAFTESVLSPKKPQTFSRVLHSLLTGSALTCQHSLWHFISNFTVLTFQPVNSPYQQIKASGGR